MSRPGWPQELPVGREVLARVSRSFYLSLRLLPRETRGAVALAYLLARAADTVADTRLVARERRLELLRALQEVFAGQDGPRAEVLAELGALDLTGDALAEEQTLLAELGVCLDALAAQPELEQALTRSVLATLTGGMVADLERFPGERASELAALETRAELRDYCYAVAGCVGEFWSLIHAARLPELGARVRPRLGEFSSHGVRLGRALQLTNVLRDLRRDLEHGRCYLPRTELAARGLAPRDLLAASAWTRLRPLYLELAQDAAADARAGLEHVLAVPSSQRLLRVAELLPLLLALRTLGLACAHNPLAADSRRKVSRAEVLRLLARGLLLAGDAPALRRWARAEAERAGLLEGWTRERLEPRRGPPRPQAPQLSGARPPARQG